MYDITNDIELTEIRNKQPTIKGFPIWLVIVEEEYKAFFTKSGLDKYIGSLDCEYEIKLLHVDDVRYVEYET